MNFIDEIHTREQENSRLPMTQISKVAAGETYSEKERTLRVPAEEVAASGIRIGGQEAVSQALSDNAPVPGTDPY